MIYQELIQKLFSINQTKGMKFGLSNTQKLCELFDHPQNKFRTIHVAGTNGKGSVTTKIAKGFECDGKRTGLYTSPHISCFRERIRINGEMISEQNTIRILELIFALCEKHSVAATFFEITTVLSFIYFAEQKVEIAVLETGLGGRLDSTNVVIPELSVITSISLDHTEILGITIEDIAKEKAGIIKNGIPVVIGPRVPNPVNHFAQKLGSPCHKVEGTFQNFHEENNAIASRCLQFFDIKNETIEKAIQASPACRMEITTPNPSQKFPCPATIIFDVAHNPDGLTHLFLALQQKFFNHKLRIVCGLSKNKDISSCVKILAHHGSAFHIVEATNNRAISSKDLAEKFVEAGIPSDKIFAEKNIEENVLLALEKANSNGEIVVICGTFFIMGRIRALLGFDEPHDSLDLN